MISARTKEALARAKARGARLGNPRLDEVRGKGAENMKAAAAARFAANILPAIQPLRAGAEPARNRQRLERPRRADGARRQMGANASTR